MSDTSIFTWGLKHVDMELIEKLIRGINDIIYSNMMA
jgi:hypothetical protein